MVIMTVVIILMKTLYTVRKELVHKIVSDARTIVAFLQLGIAMVTMIVGTVPMNPQNTARVKVALVSGTCLLVTTAIAFHEFTSATVIMIA